MQSLRNWLSTRYVISLTTLALALTVVVAMGFVLVLNLRPATASEAAPQAPVTPSFTYQGRLEDGGKPANGKYDFQFSLFDAKENGTQVGQLLPVPGVDVQNGVFTVELNFGAGVFTGEQRWLAISVSQSGANTFVALTPRQALTAVPYAMSVPWAGISDIPADIKDGDQVGTSGGSITGVTAGDGLTGGGTTGTVALSVNFGGDGSVATASRSDHTHAGQAWSTSGTAGFAVSAEAASGVSFGVAGTAKSVEGTGVFGHSSATSGNLARGVYGRADSSTGRGVEGFASSTSGENYGVRGVTNSPSGYGVYGHNLAQTSDFARGVYGQIDTTDGRAVEGYVSTTTGRTASVAGINQSPQGVAVYGANSATTSGTGGKIATGVFGLTNAVGGIGVEGDALATSGNSYGVFGYSASPNGVGVYGMNAARSQGGYAGYFLGPVFVNGTLSKSAGSFKIDHPLDPENKFLSHSFVESPDMMNIYNGNILLDGNGEAWVQMPTWFEALNMEFRYQLTAIGAPGPNLYIAQEIGNNQFKIAGGQPGMKVSWQVTGIRNDPYARAHRILVEENKSPTERGSYINPAEHGQPESRGIGYRSSSQDPLAQSANSARPPTTSDDPLLNTLENK